MADVSDNFNRANENPLSNGGKWIKPVWGTGNMVVQTNVVSSSSANVTSVALWTANGFANDQFSQFTVTGAGNYAYIFSFVRANTSNGGDSQNCYGLAIHTYVANISYIFKVVNGVSTNLGAALPYIANGQTIKLEVVGSTISLYLGGAFQTSRNDSDILFGYPGIGRNSASVFTGATIDNWSGGPIREGRAFSPIPAGRP